MRTCHIAQGALLCGDLNVNEIRREGLYVYIELTHFAGQWKLTQRCKASMPPNILIKKKR